MPQHPEYVDLQTAAKLIGYGPKKLFRLLRDKKVLNDNNLPYQQYIDRGLFKVESGNWWHEELQRYIPYGKTIATVKGIEWLQKLIQEEQAA